MYSKIDDTNDREKDIQELLRRFPLTKEEIKEYIKTDCMEDLDTLMHQLKYFPDHDFSDMFAEPEVKEKLFARLMEESFP